MSATEISRESGEPAAQQSAAATVREAIRAMHAYTLEMTEATDKLDQNESPFDWPEELKREVLERVAARPWNLYPDFELLRLRSRLAEFYGLSAENILAGNGSNELLLATLTTFVAPGRPVIVPSPSFALYEKIATILGGDVRPIPLDPRSGRLPVAAMIEEAARCETTPLIIICSPNNPTGGVLQEGELEALLATGATVIFDRAYGEFAPDVYPSPLPNLITLSTFSKAWGLAGLRLGYVSSTEENIVEIRKVKLPYNLNFISEEVALVALEKRALLDQHVAAIIAGRERLLRGLAAIPGLSPFPSKANFVTFRIESGDGRPDARTLFAALLARGILLRDVSKYRALENALRVSVGSDAQNERFLTALAEIMTAATSAQKMGERT